MQQHAGAGRLTRWRQRPPVRQLDNSCRPGSVPCSRSMLTFHAQGQRIYGHVCRTVGLHSSSCSCAQWNLACMRTARKNTITQNLTRLKGDTPLDVQGNSRYVLVLQYALRPPVHLQCCCHIDHPALQAERTESFLLAPQVLEILSCCRSRDCTAGERTHPQHLQTAKRCTPLPTIVWAAAQGPGLGL